MKQHSNAPAASSAERPLTALQRRFVEEYLKDGNAHGAALRAGYSPKSAKRAGYRLLHKPHIANALRRNAAQRNPVKKYPGRGLQRLVLKELARIAFGDLRWLVSWGPEGLEIKSSDDLADYKVALIAEISKTTGGGLKIKRQDKLKALELLMKYLRMLPDKRERPITPPNKTGTGS